MIWLDIVAWVVAVVILVPLLVLIVECISAHFVSGNRPQISSAPRPRTVVLIPAHNESTGIVPTLQSVIPNLGPTDRVLVVADNCTDDTAEIARSQGAWVVERSDQTRRGKGYALAFGRDVLQADPPEVVIVLDADCLPDKDVLELLSMEAGVTCRPVQAEYHMAAPPNSSPDRHIASFAFLLKNVIRPRGLYGMKLPCLLMGTGMAFPWNQFQVAPLDHGHIVEDMGLAVDLALKGHETHLLPGMAVRGEFPVDKKAAGTQRRRWEHGHLQVIVSRVPQMIWTALRQRRLSLLALTLELAVPPLSALVLLDVLTLVLLGIVAVVGGSPNPALLLGSGSSLAGLVLFTVWARYGRVQLPAKTLLMIPIYILRKISLYFGFLLNRQKDWVRTARPEERTAQ